MVVFFVYLYRGRWQQASSYSIKCGESIRILVDKVKIMKMKQGELRLVVRETNKKVQIQTNTKTEMCGIHKLNYLLT